MHQFRTIRYFLVTITCVLISLTSYSQRNKQSLAYHENLFVVSNFSGFNSPVKEKKSVKALLKDGARGFMFKLRFNSTINSIEVVTAANTTISFRSVAADINDFLKSHPNDILTLFFDYKFPTVTLTESLKKAGLFSKVWQQNPNQNWPLINHMIKEEKRIVCFSLKDRNDLTTSINYIWNYAVEPYFSTSMNPEFDGNYYRGNPLGSLMVYNGYNLPKDTTGIAIPFRSFDINENPYLISHTINLWKNTGKRPTFIVLNKFNSLIFGIIGNLRTHKTVNGTITYNRKPLELVSWEGYNNSITSGDYSFPVVEGEDVFLKPKKPGFRFIPEEIQIENLTQNIIQNFIAVPLELNNKLIAYYPLDHNAKDASPNLHNGKNSGVTFIHDAERGWVAEFDEPDYITLPATEELNMRNQDFTVSAWIKIKTFKYRDHTILGTEENYYRKGLHLQLRNRQPYFGFFANDLIGSTIISENQWYHVVWRYTKFNGEQAIFINGLPDGSSPKHPAFMGIGNVIIGKAINMKNYFIGRMDDVILWNRPLGDEEIWNLYQEVLPIQKDSVSVIFKRNMIWLLLAVSAIIALILIRYRTRIINTIKNQGKRPTTNITIKSVDIPNKNFIKLFGDFQILDNNGNDITDKFTPKLKQLFLVLLLFSQKTAKGISSDELTNLMWPSHNRKSAINNRGVNISKLRSLLEDLNKVSITNHQDHWKVNLSDSVFCDYTESLKLIDEDLLEDNKAFNTFFTLIQKGSLLKDTEQEWLDDFKGQIANTIIDILLKVLNQLDIKNSAESAIKISDRILAADIVSEEALSYKIKALITMGNYNQAKYTYRSFADQYKNMYGESFNTSFEELKRL
ncbi:hypothetical protein EYV94_21975 [Puteibacter caeruleilacunae]|nr:hypothetical protein EYV94_21975 [Puteibacter caeruleilacunae]